MNLDSLSFTLSQISYIVENLNKKNFPACSEELSLVSILQNENIYIHIYIQNCKSCLIATLPSFFFRSPPRDRIASSSRETTQYACYALSIYFCVPLFAIHETIRTPDGPVTSRAFFFHGKNTQIFLPLRLSRRHHHKP